MSDIGAIVRERLFALQDIKYQSFTASLIPTIEPERIIGVRSPALRKLARELLRRTDAQEYLEELPHWYLEENLMHCRFLESIRDPDRLIPALERFLPWVDNWAVSDSLNPKALHRHPDRDALLHRWMESDHTYTVRFAVVMLMRCGLSDVAFRPEYLRWVTDLKGEDYYLRMVQAWFLAEALVKQYDAALPLLRAQSLPLWVHNKAIQKAGESRVLPEDRKAQLKALRRVERGTTKTEK